MFLKATVSPTLAGTGFGLNELALKPELIATTTLAVEALRAIGVLAIVALVMATHGINDLYGKYIGPLAMVLLIEPAQAR